MQIICLNAKRRNFQRGCYGNLLDDHSEWDEQVAFWLGRSRHSGKPASHLQGKLFTKTDGLYSLLNP